MIAPSGRGTVRISILSPFIGSWSSDALDCWCARFGGSPNHLKLVWIDKNHLWARAGRWLLPKATLKTLTQAHAILLHFRNEPDSYEKTNLFHDEHRITDDRWSHAKVYSLTRGMSRRLLVTSANFSPAAWGTESRDGELTIENFELGVCAEQATWPLFDNLEVFENEHDAATVSEAPRQGTTRIMWAQAAWNGKAVAVDCRCEATAELAGEISSGSDWSPITNWTLADDGRLRSTLVPWTDATRPPSSVQLTCEHEIVSVPVFDERSPQEREDTTPPEVDENIVQTMRDELLFEQYGGCVAADIEDGESRDDAPEPEDVLRTDTQTGGDSEGRIDEDGGGRVDSYAVPTFEVARRHLGVVDNWADQVKRAANNGWREFEREVLRRDGELLIEAFQRQALRDEKKGSTRAIGAKLAAEELVLRRKHFPEA